MLSKQSIRKEHTIFLNDVQMTKEEILEIAKDFSEKEEQHFRKMLKQGGKLKIKNNVFNIKKYEYEQRNSKGEIDSPARPHNPDYWK
jgi:poly-D-alanine transfer protein DltD